jgi:phenylpropionate dioxygenase-like ring-hydroxylating dioxygenase large terminal subunit
MTAYYGGEDSQIGGDFAPLVDEGQHRFRVRTSIYTDPRVFDAEMQRVFETNWVYVGHESEVAQPGDFVTSTVGRQPVIVSRGYDAAIRVFLNACRHRGNALCREGRGNVKDFTCRYHGWVFATDGRLVAIPESDAYPETFERERDQFGLLQARTSVYRGLIFVNLVHGGGSLEDYLGEVKRYIDLWADMSPVGTIRVSRPHAYRFPGNWKFQVENGVDNYHPRFVHQSAFNTFRHYGLGRYASKSSNTDEPNRTLGFERGHCVLERPGLWSVYSAEQYDRYFGALIARHGLERAQEIFCIRHIHIFPNVCLMDANIRVMQPLGVDATSVYSYFTAFDGVTQDINDARLADVQRRLGSVGFVNTDDVEIFGGNQTGIRALDSIVLERGMHREIVHPNGMREGGATDETPQRALYRGWMRSMADAGRARPCGAAVVGA